jgi:hypothetical protein
MSAQGRSVFESDRDGLIPLDSAYGFFVHETRVLSRYEYQLATHRAHHQNADKEGDPHSPRDGGFWAHMGWIITGRSMHHVAHLPRLSPTTAQEILSCRNPPASATQRLKP